jgi:hypothetical protein
MNNAPGVPLKMGVEPMTKPAAAQLLQPLTAA